MKSLRGVQVSKVHNAIADELKANRLPCLSGFHGQCHGILCKMVRLCTWAPELQKHFPRANANQVG